MYMTATATTSDSGGWNCSTCDGKDYLNVDATTTPWGNTCSDTAIDAANCAATISDCEQTMCYKTSVATKAICGICKSGTAGLSTAYDSTLSSYTACDKASAITNCDKHGNSGQTIECYTCNSDYAVKYDKSGCASYTVDSNCRSLQSDNTNCRECWYSYYWDATKCLLKSGLTAIGSFVLAFLYVYF